MVIILCDLLRLVFERVSTATLARLTAMLVQYHFGKIIFDAFAVIVGKTLQRVVLIQFHFQCGF